VTFTPTGRKEARASYTALGDSEDTDIYGRHRQHAATQYNRLLTKKEFKLANFGKKVFNMRGSGRNSSRPGRVYSDDELRSLYSAWESGGRQSRSAGDTELFGRSGTGKSKLTPYLLWGKYTLFDYYKKRRPQETQFFIAKSYVEALEELAPDIDGSQFKSINEWILTVVMAMIEQTLKGKPYAIMKITAPNGQVFSLFDGFSKKAKKPVARATTTNLKGMTVDDNQFLDSPF